nr:MULTISPECIES: DUF4328 domain-containing protein [unclassified Streptomyces]
MQADGLDLVDSLTTLTGFALRGVHLATLVVFLMWFHRVRCNGQVFRPDGFSQSAGWAIGGWFVPLANFFLPYRTARETWDASTQYASDGSYRETSGTAVVAWWLTFVASVILGWNFARRYAAAGTPEEFRDVFSFGTVADLTTVVAAGLAVLFVRKLTAMQHVKATQGPNAAA